MARKGFCVLICMVMIAASAHAEPTIDASGLEWVRYSRYEKGKLASFLLWRYKADKNIWRVSSAIRTIDLFYATAIREYAMADTREDIYTPVALLVYDMAQPRHRIIDERFCYEISTGPVLK